MKTVSQYFKNIVLSTLDTFGIKLQSNGGQYYGHILHDSALGIRVQSLDEGTGKRYNEIALGDSALIARSETRDRSRVYLRSGDSDDILVMVDKERASVDLNHPLSCAYKVRGNQVIGERITGWKVKLHPNPSREIDLSGDVSKEDLARVISAILLDTGIKGHGLIDQK